MGYLAAAAHPVDPSARRSSRPRVSVLLPVYNGERFLVETLRSISAQTWSDFEIVVVNDGSTDGTGSILRRYGAVEPRLTVVTQENAGIAAALNAGLSTCRGELVARIDADDIMVPERLATQVAFLDRRPELGFCGSAIELINARGRVFGTRVSGLHDVAQLDALLAERRWFTYTHPSVMYRRADVLSSGGYRPAFEPCEDLDLFLRLIQAGRPGVDVAQPLVRYRQHDRSLSAGNALAQLRMRKLLFHNFYADRQGLPIQDYAGFVRSRACSGLGVRWSDAATALGAVAGYRIAAGRTVTGLLLGGIAVLMKTPRLLNGLAVRSGSRA